MSESQVELYNLALSAAGTRSKISAIDENSKESETCNLWYKVVRRSVLRSAPWASCRATSLPALISERNFDVTWAAGDPEPPWLYKHSLPSDFIYPRFLENFESFLLGDDDGQAVLYSNTEVPVLIYTKDQTVPPAWDVSLYMAMAHMLSAHIAMNLHGKAGRAQKVLDTANNYVLQARIATANENQVEYDSMPDWLLARGAFSGTTPSRFIYQNGPLLSLLGAF